MFKQVQYWGKDERGTNCQSLFGSSGAFEKTAGAPPFADWSTGDELRKFISKITPEDRKKNVYVLVNALGAGEYFGSNINADYFPWNSLAHEGDDYGYKTFLNSHAFQHHVNKDPARAFGKPVLSVLNIPMKRVELVIALDREKAKLEGADGIITRIEKGEFPDVSMGCKVPYDICSICGTRSKTRSDYCQHMYPPPDLRGQFGPNKILPDGRKIYVLNTLPRFFDISFVFIGADKTAKVMAKLASAGNRVCLGEVCAVPRLSTDVYEMTSPVVSYRNEKVKTASAHCDTGGCCNDCGDDKLAEAMNVKIAKNKLSEIIKNVPAGVFATKKLPEIEKVEDTISSEKLDSIAKNHSLGEIASTAGSLGIVLSPREFQKIILIKIGASKEADILDQHGVIFEQVDRFDSTVPYGPENYNEELANQLKDVVSDRTIFGPKFIKRAMFRNTSNNSLATDVRVSDSLLNDISAAYNGYRRDILLNLAATLDGIEKDSAIREVVLGENLSSIFAKTSSANILTPESIAYLIGAHFTDRTIFTKSAMIEAIAANNESLFNSEDLS